MEPGFFTSRQFIIAASLATLVVAGGAYATLSFGMGFMESRTCDFTAPLGTSMMPTVDDQRKSGGARRIVSYTLDANATRGSILLCTSTGDLQVRPATDGIYRLEAVIEGHGADAVDSTRFEVAIAQDGDTLRIAAAEIARGKPSGWFGMDTASTSFYLYVPDDIAYGVETQSATGRSIVTQLRISDLDMQSATGDMIAESIDLEGRANIEGSTGDIELRPRSVQAASYTVESSTGRILIVLPQRADVGYQATAESSTGSIAIALGELEVNERDRSGPSESTHVRTKGYSSAPTRVNIETHTATGDITIRFAQPA